MQYGTIDVKDPDLVPVHVQYICEKGAGQLEYQGFEDWTADEQEMWKAGLLRCKWGIGQVSIRVPVRDVSSFLALVYGYLPFVIPLWWAIWAIVTYLLKGGPRFFPTFGLCVAIGFAILNEALTKPVCHRVLSPSITSRPPEAVCKHPGMPSGHVMNAYTLMVWCFLEVVLDHHVHVEWLFIILVVMAPVPWARVYNRDHTVPQVAVSAAMGTVMGVVAYLIRKMYFPNHGQPWDWHSIDEGVTNPYSPEFK